MQSNEKNKYRKFLKELLIFQKQGENLNIKQFNTWKNKVKNELKGSYKIKFDLLHFYTISNETDYDSDDIPF